MTNANRAVALVGTTAALVLAAGDEDASPHPAALPPLILHERHIARVCGYSCLRRRVVRPHRAYLARIAQCESGRRWHIATGNGFYGGLQFTLSSWRAAGGKGYPHNATALEQKYRAVRLSRIQGWGAWPVCAYA